MPGSFGRDRRGQLVLIGAVLVAMLLLVGFAGFRNFDVSKRAALHWG